MGDFDIRIPVLENATVQFARGFSSNGTPLTSREVSVAKFIFQQSVAYDKVRIATLFLVNVPTTLGNNICKPAGYVMSDATLIHELTHVWQYQTQGQKYISNSALYQLSGIISAGQRNTAYLYTVVPGQSLYKYTAEQQAMIVEHYYRYSTGEKISLITPTTIKDYERMIAQVRAARPTLTDMDNYSESLEGEGYIPSNQWNDIPSPHTERETFVPIIRFEYRF
jgi:hypothetical protein